MTTWEQTFAKAVKAFDGETPGAELEVEVAGLYQQDAKRVQKAIDRTAALYQAGKVDSGWAVLRAELRKHQPARRRKVQEHSEADQLLNMARADAELEERADRFKATYRCPDCLRVKLPWWTKCLHHLCVQRRRHTTEDIPT